MLTFVIIIGYTNILPNHLTENILASFLFSLHNVRYLIMLKCKSDQITLLLIILKWLMIIHRNTYQFITEYWTLMIWFPNAFLDVFPKIVPGKPYFTLTNYLAIKALGIFSYCSLQQEYLSFPRASGSSCQVLKPPMKYNSLEDFSSLPPKERLYDVFYESS